MEEWLTRVWEHMLGRVTGPMTFRLILQPVMATLFALRDGFKDAREGRTPYFYLLLTDKAHRQYLLRDGWKAVARVFILGVVMDVVYQLIVFRWVYPLEVLLVAFILAILPYLLLRGPFNRIARLVRHRDTTTSHDPEAGVRRDVKDDESHSGKQPLG